MISPDRPDDAPLRDDIPEDDEDFALEESSGVDLMPELDAPESVKRGVALIKSHWKNAPNGPGVYRMIAADGEVLYVGKAKNVRKRVASYTRLAGHVNRIARMIAATADMVFISVETETDALLLESNLIKQLKPRFNVLMRDDKSFPYILIARDHDAPQITKHRGARARKGDYFGPFASVWAVNRALNALQRAFLLRSCVDSFYENRTRPCLLYQIKRCAGPCTGEISIADYEELVAEAKDFLTGKSRSVRERLAAEMTQAAERLEFERAARLARPYLRAVGDTGRAGNQSAFRRRGRRLRDRQGRGALLHRGVLFSRLSELGQSRLFSARRSEPFGRGGAGGVFGAILRRAPFRAAGSALA